MTSEELKKIETLLAKLRAIKERANTFIGADTFFIAMDVGTFEGKGPLIADKSGLLDCDRRLWQEINSAILTFFRAEFIGADTFFIATDAGTFEGKGPLIADKSDLLDCDRRLWQEINSAILTFFRAEYQATKKDLGELGVSFSDYRDTIEQKDAA